MDVNTFQKADADDKGTRSLLKQVARRLIAERGIYNVSVREIVQGAGQRNNGVVAYYFGTKEKLIREILIDGAVLIERRREAYLNDLEAEGGPKTVREAVEAIALPTAKVCDEDEENGWHYSRFLLQVSLADKHMVGNTLRDRWNAGYQRCLAHMRRLLPDCPPEVLSRRFVFMGIMFTSLLAQREVMVRDAKNSHSMWGAPETLGDIVRAITAMLEAPVD